MKHKICMKYEKCIVSVSYFVVCFAKTLAKCEKCIAGVRKMRDNIKERMYLWELKNWLNSQIYALFKIDVNTYANFRMPDDYYLFIFTPINSRLHVFMHRGP